MEEILITMKHKNWKQIKNGTQTMEVRKTKPTRMHYPFRAIVYVEGIGVVGKFDCDSTIQTIRPEYYAGEGMTCLTQNEMLEYAAGEPICIWKVQEKSVVEYEIPFPIERATGFKQPPQSWRYLNRDYAYE